ncbi:putative glucan endo-1,3-beta-glucosidase A6 [Capsicum baccatum]|uniref:glucan endo-1,3-beta-D-glucosidase n=1 Tax=Capsicum baccatum TaxID=33114 RepID=A0A2G2VJ77_CAPBA|nr:putative glucan endo-1,3-beta-glucosidase A6 [Capsicum baccatum]
MKVGIVKLYDANPEILRLLSGTNLHVSIMVPNDQISIVASNQSSANRWVRENVLSYYPATMIRYILVGNEVLSNKDDQTVWYDLVPAMTNIRKSMDQHKIHNIKIGTPLAMDIMQTSFPPSSGEFRLDISRNNILIPLLRFLNWTKSYFFIDVYPYFSWSQNPSTISLDFALFKGVQTYTDPISGYVYTNLLDQMLDSVVFAMQKLGFHRIRLAIAETGWPNGGDYDEIGANIYNAATYNRNLVRRITSQMPNGTPARPELEILTFIFSLYNENLKEGSGTERHWGLLKPNGSSIYDIDLTGQAPEVEFTTLPQPTNNEPFHGRLWCVTKDNVNEVDLGQVLEFVCRRNGTCDEIYPGKSCYQPVSIVSHANYAFSSYWAKFREEGEKCYFNGLADQTTIDPNPNAAANSLEPLLEGAEGAVPEELQSETPLELGATAGLRMLKGDAAEKILQAVRDLVKNQSTFYSKDQWVTILDGTQEGSFMWVAMNYLLGNLGKNYKSTTATIDIGGGSIQMAYAISKEQFDKAPQKVAGESYVLQKHLLSKDYNLYVHSYLNYGQLAGRAEIFKASRNESNPCALEGYEGYYSYGGVDYKVKAPKKGSSLKKCRNLTRQALKIKAKCNYKNCTFNGVWNGGGGAGQKTIHASSFFYYIGAQVGIVDTKFPSAKAKPIQYLNAAKVACQTKAADIKTVFPNTQDKNLPYLCMDLVYQYTLLVDGFGLNPYKDITVMSKVQYKNYLVGAAWPLGCAIDLVSSSPNKIKLSSF